MATIFPKRARRGDSNGHMVVQEMLEFLRDVVDAFTGKFVRGVATVPQTATFVDVSHNLGLANYSALITPLNDPAADWWVTNKTSSSMRINLSVAAPAGGISFDYLVKGA